MADGTQGFGDLFTLLGGPITAVSKNIETFRKGVEGFVTAVQTFNRTMETLDGVARRVSVLMDDLEEPVRAVLPQLTRATQTAQALIDQLSGPLDTVVPGLERLGQTLTSPTLAGLPASLGEFLDVINDLGKRLRPLGQLAEAAGGMFGMRALTAMRLPGVTTPPEPAPVPATRPAPRRAAPATKPAPSKAATSQARTSQGAASAKAGSKPGAKKATAGKAAPKKR